MSAEVSVSSMAGCGVKHHAPTCRIFISGYLYEPIITIERDGERSERCIYYGLDTLKRGMRDIGASETDAEYLCFFLDKSYRDMILACRNSWSALNYLVSSDNLITLDDRCKETLLSCGLWPEELVPGN